MRMAVGNPWSATHASQAHIHAVSRYRAMGVTDSIDTTPRLQDLASSNTKVTRSAVWGAMDSGKPT